MSLWSRISNALHSERLNHEIEEELQLHIERSYCLGTRPGRRTPQLRFDTAPARGEPQ